jgi:predicted nucleic acid-binding Zn ribbon protein
VDSAEAWLAEHDPDYAETKQGWKHLEGGKYSVPPEESLHNDKQESVYGLIELGAQTVKGVPNRLCESCGIAFEAARRDGNGQRFCSKRCMDRVEKRRNRRKNVGG